MAWNGLKRPTNRPAQLGVVYGYDGDTDGVTARWPGRAGMEPHRKPFGKSC